MPADSSFCYELNRATLGPYVRALFGWDEQVQQRLHRDWFARTRVEIVVANGLDVGVLVVERRAGEIELGRMELAPKHQRRGIGRHLVDSLLDEARASNSAVVLEVLAGNERARAWYERLGFRELEPDADRPWKILMRFDPPPVRTAAAT